MNDLADDIKKDENLDEEARDIKDIEDEIEADLDEEIIDAEIVDDEKDASGNNEYIEKYQRPVSYTHLDVYKRQDHDDKPLKALIFDSYYDSYVGVICYIRVFEGVVRPGDEIKMMNTGKVFEVNQVGYTSRGRIATKELRSGDVGFIEASIRCV